MNRISRYVVSRASAGQGNRVVNDSERGRFSQMEFLTPYELHKRWARAISLKTLANWRSLRYGPPYAKVGGRVLYKIADIVDWEERNHFRTKP